METSKSKGLLCLNDIHNFFNGLITPLEWLKTPKGIKCLKLYKTEIKIESWAIYAPFKVALSYATALGHEKKMASGKASHLKMSKKTNRKCHCITGGEL